LVGTTGLLCSFCLFVPYSIFFPFLVTEEYWVNSLAFDKMAFIFLFCLGTSSASTQTLASSRRLHVEGRDERQNKLSSGLAEPAVVPGDGQGCF